MVKQKLVIVTAFLVALALGVQAYGFADGKKKEQTKFKVRIENISNSDGLTSADGSKYPFAVSPGMFVVTKNKTDFFKVGKKANDGLEAQAEDGNPEVLAKKLLTKIGSAYMGIFNTPDGADKTAPILPGGVYEFEFTATEGMKLNLIAMFGQSNDLFYAPEKAIDLFVGGKALSGDITDRLMLWDAGTEANQPLGIGTDQAPRQTAPNTGQAENGVVRLAKNTAPVSISAVSGAMNFVETRSIFPATTDVLRVTITVE